MILTHTIFQLTSKEWEIYAKNKTIQRALNHDVCLIKTPTDKNITFDLSLRFDQIPCLDESFSLETVEIIWKLNLKIIKWFQHHGAACWVAGWGKYHVNGATKDVLQSVGLNLFDHQYCLNHRFEKLIKKNYI